MSSRVVPQWIPHSVALGLLVLAVFEAAEFVHLRRDRQQLQAQLADAQNTIARLQQSNALITLRVVALDSKDADYANARVLVAWDAIQHRGSIALQDFPLTPAGHDYQLWVLDPNAPSPLSAGVINASRVFDVPSCSMPRPGFAISLESAGGSASLTGPILFAVAPAE